MKPAVWGTHVWYSIHFIALEYPIAPSETQKQVYFDFYRNLARVLPCTVCREHFEKVWKAHPLTTDRLKSRRSLFAWTVDVHNMVNEDLGKPNMALSVALDMYTNRMKAKYPTHVSPNGACEPTEPIQAHQIAPTSLDSSVDLMEAFTAVSLLLLVIFNFKKNSPLGRLLR